MSPSIRGVVETCATYMYSDGSENSSVTLAAGRGVRAQPDVICDHDHSCAYNSRPSGGANRVHATLTGHASSLSGHAHIITSSLCIHLKRSASIEHPGCAHLDEIARGTVDIESSAVACVRVYTSCEHSISNFFHQMGMIDWRFDGGRLRVSSSLRVGPELR